MLPVIDIGLKLIDKLAGFFPTPEDKAKAQLALMQLQQEGQLKEMEISMSAIIEEAKSPDPYTSRARPSFLYVVYILLLASIPMGIIYAINPLIAGDITLGFKAWLAAIPEPILQLFGVVMLGYVGGRSWEKVKGVAR